MDSRGGLDASALIGLCATLGSCMDRIQTADVGLVLQSRDDTGKGCSLVLGDSVGGKWFDPV